MSLEQEQMMISFDVQMNRLNRTIQKGSKVSFKRLSQNSHVIQQLNVSESIIAEVSQLDEILAMMQVGPICGFGEARQLWTKLLKIGFKECQKKPNESV